jgi:hypothetical protein
MKLQAENYKGIEFIRISSLPEDQRIRIQSSFSKSRIIRILRDSELLKDCIQYSDYQDWYSKISRVETKVEKQLIKPFLKRVPLPSISRRKVFG